jgi:hypothetical protein
MSELDGDGLPCASRESAKAHQGGDLIAPAHDYGGIQGRIPSCLSINMISITTVSCIGTPRQPNYWVSRNRLCATSFISAVVRPWSGSAGVSGLRGRTFLSGSPKIAKLVHRQLRVK